MFDNLSLKLDRAFKTLKGTGKITEINVASTVKEIRRALIDADVNYKVAKEVTDKIKDEAMGRDVLISVSPGQLLIKITQAELTKLMGNTKVDIKLSGDPSVILIAGLQGSGKTRYLPPTSHQSCQFGNQSQILLKRLQPGVDHQSGVNNF